MRVKCPFSSIEGISFVLKNNDNNSTSIGDNIQIQGNWIFDLSLIEKDDDYYIITFNCSTDKKLVLYLSKEDLSIEYILFDSLEYMVASNNTAKAILSKSRLVL